MLIILVLNFYTVYLAQSYNLDASRGPTSNSFHLVLVMSAASSWSCLQCMPLLFSAVEVEDVGPAGTDSWLMK